MKNKVLTIPNLLSVFRLLLIPVFVWLYLTRKSTLPAAGVLTLSALTDVADGYIARRFAMVSDVGKVLDPIADKLTQASVLVCLAIRSVAARWLFGLMVVKELTQGIAGLVMLRRDGRVISAKWHGKASTVTLYAVMMAHLVFPDMPVKISTVLIALCAVIMLISLTLYLRLYLGRRGQTDETLPE